MTPREYTLTMEAAKERAQRLRRDAINDAWSALADLLVRAWHAVAGPHRAIRSSIPEA